MTTRQVALVSLASALATLASCTSATVRPATLQPGETCAFCRMAVSDVHVAAQLAAPGEEPQFFDDIGCLAGQLRQSAPRAAAIAWVADHRTGDWVEAPSAIYTRVDELATPMGSHLVAHRDTASRDQDSVARQGVDVPVAEVFGSTLPGGRTR